MAGRLDPEELAKKDAIDLTRTLVRFKYRRLQRHELNDLEADLLEQFDAALKSGKQFELNAGDIIEGVGDESHSA